MMILAALFAAITAICAQITLNIPPVPFTLQTLAVTLAAMILGSRYGSISMIVYVLIGAFGAPVFAGFKGGFQYLFDKTGGYLFGFILAAFVIGFIMERGPVTLAKAIFANVIGLLIIYAAGVTQLKIVLAVDWIQALQFGMLPFLIPDAIKLVTATILGVTIRKRLVSAGLLATHGSLTKKYQM